jgi:hypothetical protein
MSDFSTYSRVPVLDEQVHDVRLAAIVFVSALLSSIVEVDPPIVIFL